MDILHVWSLGFFVWFQGLDHSSSDLPNNRSRTNNVSNHTVYESGYIKPSTTMQSTNTDRYYFSKEAGQK